MGFMLSPQVRVVEKDLSDIIANVATSIAAVVGYSAKGNTKEYQLITNVQQFISEYGEPMVGNYFHYCALSYLAHGNKLYALRVVNGAKYGGVKIMKSLATDPNSAYSSGESDPSESYTFGSDEVFTIYAKDPGKWNDNIAIKVTDVNETDHTFKIIVGYKDSSGTVIDKEEWLVSRYHQVDGYGLQQYLEDKINGNSKYISVLDNDSMAEDVYPKENTDYLAFSGGDDGSAVSDSEVNSGWDKFANPDKIDVNILINAGYTGAAVANKLKSIAESRKDCIAILDVPYNDCDDVSDTVSYRSSTLNINSSYCAIYAPWIQIYDQWNDTNVWIPPSGMVAGAIAYNDYVGEAWFAPAGFNRGLLSAISVQKVYTLGERDLLYEAQINPIQSFRGDGIVIWGQKNMQTKASALNRINVRRLLIVIEKAVSTSLKYFLFEPNDDITRLRIVQMIDEYLRMIQNRRGIDSYQVVCDESNNTPDVIDRNELIVTVYIKPTHDIEYISLDMVITRSGASFEELISRGIV